VGNFAGAGSVGTAAASLAHNGSAMTTGGGGASVGMGTPRAVPINTPAKNAVSAAAQNLSGKLKLHRAVSL